MQQHQDRQQEAERIAATAESVGRYQSRTFELTLDAQSPEIWVRDTRTGKLVAYSSTRADYKQSLDEFIFDYLI